MSREKEASMTPQERMAAGYAAPAPAAGFELNEGYERMLEQRERDPSAYQMQHSLAAKLAAEYYARAKARAGK